MFQFVKCFAFQLFRLCFILLFAYILVYRLFLISFCLLFCKMSCFSFGSFCAYSFVITLIHSQRKNPSLRRKLQMIRELSFYVNCLLTCKFALEPKIHPKDVVTVKRIEPFGLVPMFSTLL